MSDKSVPTNLPPEEAAWRFVRSEGRALYPRMRELWDPEEHRTADGDHQFLHGDRITIISHDLHLRILANIPQQTSDMIHTYLYQGGMHASVSAGLWDEWSRRQTEKVPQRLSGELAIVYAADSLNAAWLDHFLIPQSLPLAVKHRISDLDLRTSSPLGVVRRGAHLWARFYIYPNDVTWQLLASAAGAPGFGQLRRIEHLKRLARGLQERARALPQGVYHDVIRARARQLLRGLDLGTTLTQAWRQIPASARDLYRGKPSGASYDTTRGRNGLHVLSPGDRGSELWTSPGGCFVQHAGPLVAATLAYVCDRGWPAYAGIAALYWYMYGQRVIVQESVPDHRERSLLTLRKITEKLRAMGVPVEVQRVDGR